MSVAARKIRLIMELRNAGVTNTAVLSAIELVPREIFLPETFQDRAYDNRALPIGLGQTISQPLVVAIMTDALELNDRMKVLEIGTGSGYQTAILARLCRRVYTIERHKPLLREAEARLETLKVRNVTTRHADGAKGWPEQAPFERIIVTAAAAEPPPRLLEQLADGGIMVVPVGGNGDQDLVRIRRKGDAFETEHLCGVRFVPLVEGTDFPAKAAAGNTAH